MEKQIAAMRRLGMSKDEIKQVLEDDKRIDKGEKLFELSAEQKAVEKKAKNAGTRTTVYQFKKRERKADNDKQFLMQMIETMVSQIENCENFEMTNKERECLFTFNDKKYKITLSAPRS